MYTFTKTLKKKASWDKVLISVEKRGMDIPFWTISSIIPLQAMNLHFQNQKRLNLTYA